MAWKVIAINMATREVNELEVSVVNKIPTVIENGVRYQPVDRFKSGYVYQVGDKEILVTRMGLFAKPLVTIKKYDTKVKWSKARKRFWMIYISGLVLGLVILEIVFSIIY